MQGPSRKILQAILYESIAVAVLSPSISFIYDEGLAHAGALSLMLSVCALLWNVLFNYAFEFWEAHQLQRARTLGRRLLHSLGFEGGLVLLLVPLVAWCHGGMVAEDFLVGCTGHRSGAVRFLLFLRAGVSVGLRQSIRCTKLREGGSFG